MTVALRRTGQLAMRLLSLWILAASAATAADEKTPQQLAREGTVALRAGNFGHAIECYDRAIEQGLREPSLLYNKALAHYRNQQVDSAKTLFAQVAGTAAPGLASRARYNLGNVHYAQALQIGGQDAEAAVQQLRSAIKHYRKALSLDPLDKDARANIELAGRLINELRRQQQNQSEQNQPGQDQPGQDQSEQNQSEQNQSEQNQSGQDSQPSEDQQQEQPHEDQQQETQQETQQAPQPNDQQQPNPPAEPSQEPASPTDNPAADEQPAQPPEGQLTARNEMQDADAATEAMPRAWREGQTMTHQEAQKMLQAIRDREFRRRLQQRQQTRRRRIPVAKDW